MYVFIFTILAIIAIAIIWPSLKWIKVNHHAVYFENLPKHLAGFRILQISDLHNRSKRKKSLDIWPTIKNLHFDMVAITGDIILRNPLQIYPHKYDLKDLAKKAPTFYVEGNHDAAHYPKISLFLKECGITCLYNHKTTLEHNGGFVDIAGTKDFTTLRKTNYQGLAELFEPKTNFCIALTHQPQVWDKFKDKQPNITLSGHTHGGQVRLPFLPTLYAPRQGILPKYGAGFYEHKNTYLFVSVGVGATDFPIRFWNRPAIEVFELCLKK